ncbi:MAG TPA: hypothetical protein VNE71_14310, partial [Myxococcota bacterium]|nr:hypothetical protein [Myxococcota bacterium]
PPPDLQAIKDGARDQARAIIRQAIYPCTTATTGLLLLFGVPLPLGPALGGPMIEVATPVCASLTKRLLELAKIYKDPPDPDFGTIAPVAPGTLAPLDLSSCASLSGDERRLCRRVGKLAGRYAGKVARAEAIATALRITVERASGALAADDQRALKRQLRAAKKRAKQLEKARTAAAKAGQKLASSLGESGVTGLITEAQFSEAADVVLAGLAAQGLADAEARDLLGPALTPTALDLLAVLAEP